MKMMIGSQKVRLYQGHLAKSGKSIIEFGGHKLSHLSKVADKSDLLVHNETGVVLRAYPAKTDRAIVLDDLAGMVHVLEHYLKHQESFEICDVKDLLAKPVKEATSVLELLPAPHNIGVEHIEPVVPKDTRKYPTDTQAIINDIKYVGLKKYNQKDFHW